MVDELRFVSIREILSRVARHPMLQDVDLEAGIQYTLDFFGIVGMPQIYDDRLATVHIHNYKGELPCDIVRIHQVRDEHTKNILRSMTDNFNGKDRFIPGGDSFKTQNRIIYTSFPEGDVLVSYQATHTDSDGLPMIPEDSPFLIALEAYIKKERFQVLYDQGKLRKDIYDNALQSYYLAKGRVVNRYKMPSESEMQTITGLMHRMVPSTNEFENGFKGLGDREYWKVKKSFRR